MSKRRTLLIIGAFAVMALAFLGLSVLIPENASFIHVSLIAGMQEILMFGLPAMMILFALGGRKTDLLTLVKAPDPMLSGLSMLSAVAYVLSAVLLTTFTYSILQSLGVPVSLPEPMSPETFPELLVAFVTSAFIPAVCEETFFRLALPSLLERRLGTKAAMILSAVLFSALHLTLIAVPMLLVLSYLMHRLFGRYKNLSLLFIFHGMYNFSVLVFNYTKAEPGFTLALVSVFIFVFSIRFLFREET